jgi:predicted nucleic acid-binding protein
VIVLDTNVISELTRQIPEPGVISWLDALPAEEVGTTAVTAAELLYGVARMPAGRRKTELAAAVSGLLGDDFRDRVLPFDEQCASRYADIVCGRETLGRPIGVADAQIAAICRTAEATLATRNTADFSGTGIELINPWKPDRPGPIRLGRRT